MNKASTFSTTMQWYDNHAKDFSDRMESYSDTTLQDKFSSMIPTGGTIIDAGCSSGRDTNYFHLQGYQAVGVDYAKELIKIARQKYAACTFVQGDFRSLDFPSNHAQGIWAHASLVHLDCKEDISKALAEFHRILKPNGILHVSIKESEKDPDQERHFIYLKQKELEQALTKSGFQLVEPIIRQPSQSRPGLVWLISFSRKTNIS